jgi:enoyl-CoA hydratase/carnithine racemase
MSVVLYQVRDRVATIQLNRPDKLNAINAQMREELFGAFEDVERNPDVWVAIITGNSKVFSVGHDLVQMAAGGVPGTRTTDELYEYQLSIYKPIIAAIDGYCLAQGTGLALCSDIRIMTSRAQFGWPQVKRGISSISGPTLLAHRVPLNIALEILMTGEPIRAEQALRLNLVNRVVEPEELLPTAYALAAQINQNAPLAVRAMKEATLRAFNLPFPERVHLAREVSDRLISTADHEEGLRAFNEKRKPVWTGR